MIQIINFENIDYKNEQPYCLFYRQDTINHPYQNQYIFRCSSFYYYEWIAPVNHCLTFQIEENKEILFACDRFITDEEISYILEQLKSGRLIYEGYLAKQEQRENEIKVLSILKKAEELYNDSTK